VVNRSNGGEDRTAETYQYDAAGMKTKIIHVDPAQHPPITGWGVEGLDTAYPAKGAANVSTRYNQREQPAELLFHDPAGRLLSRVDFRYDRDGNLVEEAQTDIAGAMLAEMGASMSEAQLEAVRKLFGGSFQLHRYDEQGRRVGTRRRIGQLSEENDTMPYNEHGDRIEAISVSTARGYNLDDEGQISEAPSEERSNRSETLFRYDYDARGNWVRKTIESRAGELFNVEHRTIDYFD
jgi:hypothetical protein